MMQFENLFGNRIISDFFKKNIVLKTHITLYWHGLRNLVSRGTENYLPMYINKTEMSAGETPLILEACEIVTGRILLSFCFASIDIDFIF